MALTQSTTAKFLLIASIVYIVGCVVVICLASVMQYFATIAFGLVGIAIGALGIWTSIKNVNWATMTVIITGFLLGFAFLVCMSVWVLAVKFAQSVVYWDNLTRKEMGEMEQYNECCGKDGPSYYTENNQDIPETCYSPRDEGPLYKKGCKKIMDEVALFFLPIIVSLEVVSCILSFLIAIAALLFRRSTRRDSIE